MHRYIERLKNLENALKRLKEGIEIPNPDTLQIDGILQRFEFTFELSWKTIKDYLEYEGFSEKIGSPREIIQQAFKQHIIEDGDGWIKMMLARNSLSHLYDEETSRKIYNEIKEKYVHLINDVVDKLKNI